MDFFFLASVVVFFSLYYKVFHLLSILVGVEVISLYVFFSLIVMVYYFFFDFFVLLFFMSLMACESAVGLVLFVFFTRSHSKDYVYYMSVLQF